MADQKDKAQEKPLPHKMTTTASAAATQARENPAKKERATKSQAMRRKWTTSDSHQTTTETAYPNRRA